MISYKPEDTAKVNEITEGTLQKIKRTSNPLTPAQTKEFQDAAHRTWDAIGGDIFECMATCDGKDINKVTMSRNDVIETVLDADHMVSHGHITDPVVKEFARSGSGNYDLKRKLLKETFTFKKYGM